MNEATIVETASLVARSGKRRNRKTQDEKADHNTGERLGGRE